MTRFRILNKWILLLIFFAVFSAPFAAAQEEPEETEPGAPPIDSDWNAYLPELYSRGDKIFTVSFGLIFPTVFAGPGLDGNSHNINLGGMGSIAYTYFLNSHFFIGGELAGMFASTGGENMFYAVPFGAHFGYQLILGRFEIPFMIMAGAAPQKYLEKGFFGLIIKPSVSGYFRFNSDWSFGLNVKWWMLPQWPKNGKEVLGNFMEITLSARYHF